MVDTRERVRLLRGVNVSGRSKLPPFRPFDDPAALDGLEKYGFNVIRLLLIWEGIAPERGGIDEAYLDAMVQLAQDAGQRGLWVLVDIHQDLFARPLGGDGAPAWVTGETRLPPAGKSWFWRYFDPRVWRFEDAFWRDENGWQSSFIEALGAVMKRFASVDAVIGYDVWNEPMANPLAVASGKLEREWLPRFYGACSRLRDEHDPTRLLFVEPPALSGLGAPIKLPRLDHDKIVYAPHAYDTAAVGLGRYWPRASTFPATMRAHERAAERMDAPMFVGEFGVLNDTRNGVEMLEHECRWFDRHHVSWSAWHYNPTDVDWNDEGASLVEPGGGERPFTHVLGRPFPAALAGRPRRWQPDASLGWSLQFTANSDAISEFVVPTRWAPDGFDVDVEGGEAISSEDRVEVRSRADADVTVRLRPK